MTRRLSNGVVLFMVLVPFSSHGEEANFDYYIDMPFAQMADAVHAKMMRTQQIDRYIRVGNALDDIVRKKSGAISASSGDHSHRLLKSSKSSKSGQTRIGNVFYRKGGYPSSSTKSQKRSKSSKSGKGKPKRSKSSKKSGKSFYSGGGFFVPSSPQSPVLPVNSPVPAPTAPPSVSSNPTGEPTRSISTEFPTALQEVEVPTFTPTEAFLPFESLAELVEAVDEYVDDRSPESNVARIRGFPINAWDVSQLSDFRFLFSPSSERSSSLGDFNEDLDQWDMSNAVSLDSMFLNAIAFNGDISTWDTRNVQSATFLFSGAVSFRGDLSSWDTSSFQSAFGMFRDASAFDSDIGGWDVSNVRDMDDMFLNAASFNQDISSWDVSGVVDAAGFTDTFAGAASFDQNLCAWGDLIQGDSRQVERMFINTGCASASDPDLEFFPKGPFCSFCG